MKLSSDKSPVKIRLKNLANGNKSIYLDIYHNGVRRKEYLKLYLVPEDTGVAREANEKTIEIAETIKAERVLSIQSSKSPIYNKVNRKELSMPFADYMESEIRKLEGLRTKYYLRRYRSGIEWVRRYDRFTSLEGIDKEWIRGFLKFLHHTPGKFGRILNQNTMYEYLIYVANILNIAVREGLIANNPTRSLNAGDRPRKYEGERSFLTEEEIKKLVAVPSPKNYNHIRRAFLFACFCGLRYSDLQQLRWKNIRKTEDGMCVDKKLQKTQRMEYLPLNKTAVGFLPDRGKDEELVFELPKSMVTVEAYVKVWSEFAGIDKHVTFHTSRHTFAVNLLAYGGDVFTLSKLLGHKRVTTTQIYAEILGEKKRKTAELMDKFMEE